MVEIIIYIMLGIVVLALVVGLIGMFTINSDPYPDEKLYGMSAEEYKEKMINQKTK